MPLHIQPEKTVPLPDSLAPEEPSTLRESMELASHTAEVIKGLGGQIPEDPDAQRKADEVFKEFTERAKQQYEDAMNPTPAKNKGGRPRKYPVQSTSLAVPTVYDLPVADRITGMLREYNNEFVADATQLRKVATNKLLDLASCGDPKIEIKAVEMLGKISDVGLFSEKTEINVTYSNTADLDQAIKDNVRKLMKLYGGKESAVDIDLDKELGLPFVEDVTPVTPATPIDIEDAK